jgi:hypothetical protein
LLRGQALLLIDLRHQQTLRSVRRLLLIGGLLLVAFAPIRSVAEQELDEAAAHIGAFGVDRSRWLGRLLSGLIGINYGGFRRWRELDRRGLMKSGADTRCAGEQRKRDFSEHRRTLYCFVTASSAKQLNGAWHAPIKIKTASVW